MQIVCNTVYHVQKWFITFIVLLILWNSFVEVVNNRTSMAGRKRKILTSEESIEWRTESHQLGGRHDKDSSGHEG